MGNAIQVIRELVEVCRRYDPAFDADARAYESPPFRLYLEAVPEGEIEAIAIEFGERVRRTVNFAVDRQSCPTVQPSSHIRIGRLAVSLVSNIRRPTSAELDAALAEIRKKVETCCKLGDALLRRPALTARNGD